MKRALFLAFALTACGSTYPGMTAIHQECGYNRVPFDQSWACVKVGIQDAPADRDLIDQFTALGDVMAERVKAGQITDAEAKAVMAEARTKVNNVARARYESGSSRSGPTVFQPVGGGTVIAY